MSAGATEQRAQAPEDLARERKVRSVTEQRTRRVRPAVARRNDLGMVVGPQKSALLALLLGWGSRWSLAA